MCLTNKVVIVTGGTAGIGAATVVSFAKEGAKVVIVGINEVKLKEVAEECKKLNADYLAVKADVSKENDANKIINDTIKKYGKLDILVNNAGIVYEGTILDGRVLKNYDDIMNTNLKSVMMLTCLAAPYLIKTKENIVNISSVAGTKLICSEHLVYSMSKAALDLLTRGSALELAPHGVRVNEISPGPVKTDILKVCGSNKTIEGFQSSTALGRISEPQEIADLILFLASDKAKGVTGSNYLCDNGILLKN